MRMVCETWVGAFAGLAGFAFTGMMAMACKGMAVAARHKRA
jgi:hypothetical protein